MRINYLELSKIKKKLNFATHSFLIKITILALKYITIVKLFKEKIKNHVTVD